MARIYLRLIQKSMRTIDSVPEKLRADVQALLDEESKQLD